MRILGIGAHPDDIELGAGGTIAEHINSGDEVHFLVLTYGEKGGEKDIRKIEAERSAQVLNVKSLAFGGLEDTRINEGIETILKIEEVINKIRPHRIYTQCVNDRHQDHRNTAYATFSAARSVAQVLCYESPDSYPNFLPQYYVSISLESVKAKISALQQFNSQNGKMFFEVEAIRGLASFRGYQVGIPHAEAFEVARIIQL